MLAGAKFVNTVWSDDTVVVRALDSLSAAVGNETVLMNVRDGKYVGLDPIGSAIWNNLENPVSIAVLCSSLHAVYAAEPEALRKDVEAFLEKMCALNLIAVVS